MFQRCLSADSGVAFQDQNSLACNSGTESRVAYSFTHLDTGHCCSSKFDRPGQLQNDAQTPASVVPSAGLTRGAHQLTFVMQPAFVAFTRRLADYPRYLRCVVYRFKAFL